MDDEKNEVLFRILQEDCAWKQTMDMGGYKVLFCSASSLACQMEVCVPFKFAVFFNRQEVKKG
jgi:hypothetical protein